MSIGGPILLAISAFAVLFGFIPRLRPRPVLEVDSQFVIVMSIATGVLTVVLLLLLARRVSRLKRVVEMGTRISATVADIGFFRDRGRVEFQYTYEGQEYRTGTVIMKNSQTQAIAAGAQIEVAIDPRKPGKVVIVQLYCNE